MPAVGREAVYTLSAEMEHCRRAIAERHPVHQKLWEVKKMAEEAGVALEEIAPDVNRITARAVGDSLSFIDTFLANAEKLLRGRAGEPETGRSHMRSAFACRLAREIEIARGIGVPEAEVQRRTERMRASGLAC